ncbi:hypothetical protein [Candidatus Nitrospira bockiana]
MMQILDRQTLEEVLTPADLTGVRRTIEEGLWGGVPVPGDEGWDWTPREGMPCERLISLGLHYFTTRHPGADHILYAIAAQILHTGATGWSSGYPVEEDPRYDRASAWLFAIAGGQPALPGALGCLAISPPMNRETGTCEVPGGAVAFTRFSVEFLDRVLFGSEDAGRMLADEYLSLHHPDPLAQRATVIFSQVQRWQYPGLSPIRCFDCGATGLEHWYTSKQGGYSLCAPCFETRQARGLAKEGEA